MTDKQENPDAIDVDLQKLLDDIDDAPQSESKPPIATPPEEPIAEIPQEEDKVENLLAGFNQYRHDIERGFRDDRIKIQEYIDLIINDANTHGGIKTSHMDAISSLMATKAMTTANKIKMLDAIAKMLSAMRGHNNAENNSNTDISELNRILESDSGDAP